MGIGRSRSRYARLWQWPLFLFASSLFAFAAYLFIDPKPAAVASAKLESARALVKQERPEAAMEILRELVEDSHLRPVQRGAAHLLMGEAIEEQIARGKKEKSRRELGEIIGHIKDGLSLGIEADAQTHRRLGESYEGLGKIPEAISHYQKVIALDPSHSLKWERRIIELWLSRDQLDLAMAGLEKYLQRPDLARGEKAWALGERAHVMVDRGQYKGARGELAAGIKLFEGDEKESSEAGSFNYWLGYCAWKLGQVKEAERYFRVARDQLRPDSALDADAGYALGKIHQDQGDWAGAAAFYMAVIQAHMDARIAPFARLGRGVCRIALKDDEAGLGDLADLTKYVRERESAPGKLKEELVAGLAKASELLTAHSNFQGALEAMAYEQEVSNKPTGEFFQRLARLYEKRADQMERGVGDGKVSDRALREQKVRETRAKAGDAYVAYSRALVVADDKLYGAAMWKGIELYEAGGDVPRVIAALEAFIGERPGDPLAPEAMLKLGNAYHAAGLFDKAIATYKQCQFLHPTSLAGTRSGVPLARAMIAKGPEFYAKAEAVLKGVVENAQVTPDAPDFRDALMELANLYYRTARYELAVSKLEEMNQRYENDERKGQLLFLMADSYRKSAGLLESKIDGAGAVAASKSAMDLSEAMKAKAERLGRARDLYRQVIEHYRGKELRDEKDRLYQKLAYFYRADCVYDLGEYVEAIKLYDEAASVYQNDPSALAAYIQIVNANVALGRTEGARTANERAKWMLRRMPGELFSDTATSYAMPKAAWETWLKWSGEVGK
jgi:tetratricopeptide (TPR) repeat protein